VFHASTRARNAAYVADSRRLYADDIAGMENALDLYAEAPDRKRPVVCFDKSPMQIIGEVRE
jgi:hypothetical protein